MNETRLIGQILRSMSALEMEIHNTQLTDVDLEVIDILSDSRRTLTKALALYKEHREKARIARLEIVNEAVINSEMKQNEIAQKIGISPEHLSTVLNGKNTLTDDLKIKILEVCKSIKI